MVENNVVENNVVENNVVENNVVENIVVESYPFQIASSRTCPCLISKRT